MVTVDDFDVHRWNFDVPMNSLRELHRLISSWRVHSHASCAVDDSKLTRALWTFEDDASSPAVDLFLSVIEFRVGRRLAFEFLFELLQHRPSHELHSNVCGIKIKY